MAFTIPKELRNEWHEFRNMQKKLYEQGTANSDFNIVRYNSLKDKLLATGLFPHGLE